MPTFPNLELCKRAPVDPLTLLVSPPTFTFDYVDGLIETMRLGGHTPDFNEWQTPEIVLPTTQQCTESPLPPHYGFFLYVKCRPLVIQVSTQSEIPNFEPPWIQTEGLDIYTCLTSPWLGAWPMLPPDPGPVIAVNENVFDAASFTIDLTPYDSPIIIAFACNGFWRWEKPAAFKGGNSSWLTISGVFEE